MIYFLLIIAFIVVVAIITVAISKAKQRRKRETHLYSHQECPNYFGPHGDSLIAIFIEQTKNTSPLLIDSNKQEWEIIEKVQSDPEGPCGEYISIKEKRNNQSEWEYHICYIDHFEWLLQFDLPRILTDKTFFNEHLLKAESGNSDAQTLVGSCYAHCLDLAKSVITFDEERALYWWNKAAGQGHHYAMMELAIYYFNKKDYEKAVYWNARGKCKVFIIERYQWQTKRELLIRIRSEIRYSKSDYSFQTFIENTQDLMNIQPEDVEKRIGIKKMSMLMTMARKAGWGSEDYWNQLHRNTLENNIP